MKLFYYPGFCSLSPHIVAREAGVEVELKKVDTKTKQIEGGGDFRALNPKGYVPALQLDDGAVLTEGPAIILYLADRNPASGLAAREGTMERYRLQEMLAYVNSEIHKGYDTLFNSAASDALKDERRAHLQKRYGLIEKQLAGGDYVLGPTFTVADAYLFVITGWSKYVKLDLAGFPNLLAYQKRVAARPAVQAAMKAEGLFK
jgi:glutathione S-transferase